MVLIKIKSKKLANDLINQFDKLFEFDDLGQKHYLYFTEKNTENTLTVMKYPSGVLTVNRRGEDSNDDGETVIDLDECIDIFWINRAAINRIIERKMTNNK
ncbi:MAG: hypothetical protein GX752_05470 [Clostridium sp.]|nr:hypothetical protein [Clostridium sp.]